MGHAHADAHGARGTLAARDRTHRSTSCTVLRLEEQIADETFDGARYPRGRARAREAGGAHGRREPTQVSPRRRQRANRSRRRSFRRSEPPSSRGPAHDKRLLLESRGRFFEGDADPGEDFRRKIRDTALSFHSIPVSLTAVNFDRAIRLHSVNEDRK